MFDPAEIMNLLKLGQFDRAIHILQSHALRQTDAQIEIHLGLAQRLRGNLIAANEAFDRALAIEPYQFIAMLSKASVLELLGRLSEAVACYRNALKIAPSMEGQPGSLTKQLTHARELVQRHDHQRYETLKHNTLQEAATLRPEARERFEEAVAIFSGQQRVYTPQPLLLHYPGLPAVCFWQRDHFPWLETLESQTSILREEILSFLQTGSKHARPYIDRPPGSPLNQWESLNGSMDWTTVHLWRDGLKNQDLLEPFKKTIALLDSLPMAHQVDFAPTAMYSVLAPHTHIPAHTGSTNVRQIVHLPLVVPPGCTFRVGNFTREWKEGVAWVFDDTIEHEAKNTSAFLRIILIFDVWNPILDELERTAIAKLLSSSRKLSVSGHN